MVASRRIQRMERRPSRSLTSIFIAVNIGVYLLYIILSSFHTSSSTVIQTLFVLTPLSLVENPSLYTITLFTSMFTHELFFHLLVNMISLFFIGSFVEHLIGKRRYFWLYVISGLFAGLFFIFFAYIGAYIPRGDFLFGTPKTSALGASGAIFGLLGLLVVLLPKKKVYLILGPLIVFVLQIILFDSIPIGFQTLFSLLTTALLVVTVFGMFSSSTILRRISIPVNLPLWAAPIVAIVPLLVISFFVPLPIGNTAHLGGLVVGLAYGWYLRIKYARKVSLLGRMFR